MCVCICVCGAGMVSVVSWIGEMNSSHAVLPNACTHLSCHARVIPQNEHKNLYHPFPFLLLVIPFAPFWGPLLPIPRYDLIQLKTRRKRNWGTALVLLRKEAQCEIKGGCSEWTLHDPQSGCHNDEMRSVLHDSSRILTWNEESDVTIMLGYEWKE